MLSGHKVSVVMPACNAAAYLDEAVNSILGQTLRDLEFIIINNGSTDDTGAILDKYQKLDPAYGSTITSRRDGRRALIMDAARLAENTLL
jgi:glycosyltransferase involved in cell wall biosynthesis